MLFTLLLIACLTLTSQFTVCGGETSSHPECVEQLREQAGHASDEGQSTLAKLVVLAGDGTANNVRERTTSGSSNKSSSPRSANFCFPDGFPGEKNFGEKNFLN